MSSHSRYLDHLAALQGSARFRDTYNLAAVPNPGGGLPRASHHLQDYLIGSGAFGLVFCCVRTLDVDVRYAIKVILKSVPVSDPTTTTGEVATSSSGVQCEDEEIRMIKNISILFAKRRGAVILEDEWDDSIAHFIVMSYLEGTFGDAINLLSSSGRRGESPEEKKEREEGLWKIAAKFARDISFQLVLMHLVKIVHRDLSLGNIMYSVNSGNVTFTVIDFNLSKRMNELEPGTGRYGYPGPPNFGSLIPPDLRGSVNAKVIYDEKCDCWSFGVLLFKLLFSGRDFDQSLLAGKLEQFEESERIKTPFHLVLLLTRADPRERITMKEAFQHPWLGEFDLGFEEKREMRALLEHAEEILARNPTCRRLAQEALNTFEVFHHPRQDLVEEDDDVAEVAMGTTPPKGLLIKAATRAWRQKRKNEDKYATSNFSKLRQVAKEGKEGITSPVIPRTPCSTSMSRVNSNEKLGTGSSRRDSSDKKNRTKKQSQSLTSMDINELVADETGDYDEEVRSVASSQSATSSSWTSRSGASRSVSRATTPGLFGLPAAGFGMTRTLSCESVGCGGGVAGMGGLRSLGSSSATPRATLRKDSDFARRDAAEAELARIQTRIATKVNFLTEKLEEIETKHAETREAVIKDLIVRRNHRFRPLPEELRKSIYTNILTKDTSELSPRKIEDLLQEAKIVMSRLNVHEDSAIKAKGKHPEDAVRPLLSKLQEYMNLLVRYTTHRALLSKGISDFRGRFQNVAQRIERFLKSRAREASLHVINTFQSFQVECLLLLHDLDNLEWKR